MKTFIILIIFVGMFMITHGVYNQKITAAESKKQIEYKFIPRTYYEEQLAETNLADKMFGMFNKDSPWTEKNVGEKIVIPRNVQN